MKAPALVLGVALACALAAAACGNEPEEDGPGARGGKAAAEDQGPAPDFEDPRTPDVEVLPDPLEGLPTGQAQLDKVCARGQRDAVTRAFCGTGKTVTSIVELQDALGLGFEDRSDRGQNGGNGNPAFAILGHSSSLIARSVSAINPRAFVFSPPPGRPQRIPGYVVMGFARGETFVEIAAEDAQARKLTFYLFKFDVACERAHACRPGDLLTPAVEKGWTGFSLYDDEDLKNTLADCRHCHQPGGPSTRPMLRMQELRDPWTHWFHNDRPGGLALFKDFLAAHGDKEDYAGIPATIMQQADGRALEDLVVGQGFSTQPNQFDTQTIEREVKTSSSQQPEVNVPVGKSATWQRLYDAAARGESIPPPYHDVKVTDPQKLAFASSAYRNMVEGRTSRADLPDIRRVFLDDALEGMTMRPKKGASGREVLVQACAQCHNPRLDPSISRAQFDVTKLDSMNAQQKANAIARLKLPPSDRKHMPPAMMRSLTDEALNAAIAELAK